MAAPYDTVDTVLNTARARLNDAIVSIGGDILTDAQPFTQTFTNTAWRRLQDYLTDLGMARFKQEVIFSAVPLVTSTQTGVQVSLGWNGYFDGTTLLGSPALPQDFISPLDLWERANGSNGIYQPLDQCINGLPAVAKTTLNKLWEWREETLYFPGATVNTDLRVRYASYLPDFLTAGAVQWFNQPVPLMRALDSLAWYIAAEVARARGDVDAALLEKFGQDAATIIFNRDNAQGKSFVKRSELGRMPDRYTPSTIKGYPGAPVTPKETGAQ